MKADNDLGTILSSLASCCNHSNCLHVQRDQCPAHAQR